MLKIMCTFVIINTINLVKFKFQVGVDLIGPLPKSKSGNQYIVTLVVDNFSKWLEAAVLPDKKAEGMAQFLYQIICRYNLLSSKYIYLLCLMFQL